MKIKHEIFLDESLKSIMDYIKGNTNLENATNSLSKFGFGKKNIKKVLTQTSRRNVIKFKK